MKSKKSLFSLFILLFIFSCNTVDPVITKIQRLPNEQTIVDLKTVTSFNWDSVVICNPSIQQEELDLLLPGYKKDQLDLQKAIIFLHEGKVVYQIIYKWNPDKPNPVEFNIGNRHFLVVNINAAIFNLKRLNIDDEYNFYIELALMK